MTDVPRPTCTKPDRDSPKLLCGYPLPCPHHTVIMHANSEHSELGEQVERTLWLARHPRISIGMDLHEGAIRIQSSIWWATNREGGSVVGERRLPIDCKQQEIRDACDELTRESILALEVG